MRSFLKQDKLFCIDLFQAASAMRMDIFIYMCLLPHDTDISSVI